MARPSDNRGIRSALRVVSLLTSGLTYQEVMAATGASYNQVCDYSAVFKQSAGKTPVELHRAIKKERPLARAEVAQDWQPDEVQQLTAALRDLPKPVVPQHDTTMPAPPAMPQLSEVARMDPSAILRNYDRIKAYLDHLADAAAMSGIDVVTGTMTTTVNLR